MNKSEAPWGGKTGGRCYETHPPLVLKDQKGEYKVYGGNCGHPVHLDCDVYVALQSGSHVRLPMPWQPGYGQIAQIDYPIRDMHAPSSPNDFKLMIDWLCNQLHDGKKVHIGCIGGHGRTGTVLAALTAKIMPEVEDPIGYVRQHYCDHAVESSEQVDFLIKHFGAKKVLGYKEGRLKFDDQTMELWGKPAKGMVSDYKPARGKDWPKSGASEIAPKTQRFTNSKRHIDPVPSRRNIFEKHA